MGAEGSALALLCCCSGNVPPSAEESGLASAVPSSARSSVESDGSTMFGTARVSALFGGGVGLLGTSSADFDVACSAVASEVAISLGAAAAAAVGDSSTDDRGGCSPLAGRASSIEALGETMGDLER